MSLPRTVRRPETEASESYTQNASPSDVPPRGSSRPRPERMTTGIILERHVSARPWQEHVWRLVDVIPHGTSEAPWAEVARGDGWVRYAACQLTLELFPRETDGYAQNLTSTKPQVFVILRSSGGDFEFEPFHATVCPYEAQAYLDSGEDTVEGVAMPPEIRQWVTTFVERNHRDERFVKRRQKPKAQMKEEEYGTFWRQPPVLRSGRGQR